MAPVSSKDCDEQELARRARVSRAVTLHLFQAICQYCVNMQSEPMLFKQLCDGDIGKASRIMGGSMSAVAILGLSFNQGIGRISDSMGRKSFAFVGPILNVLVGCIMYAGPKSLSLAVLCRIIRNIGTLFSASVIGIAALMDTFPADEFPAQLGKAQAATGVAVIVSPVVESIILSKTGNNPRASFLMLAGLGAVHAATTTSLFVESLAPKDRKPLSVSDILKASNPFGFLRVFTGKAHALKQLLCITTLQHFMEAKNLSDVSQLYMVNQLGWGVSEIRNYAVTFGLLVVGQSAALVPALLKKLGILGFTTVANMCNALDFFLKGSVETGTAMIGAVVVGMPGANGAATNGLRGVANQLAADAGYGGGEFSAIYNSLRSLSGALATSVLGFAYGYCRDNGLKVGFTFYLAGVIGALLPQVLLQLIDKSVLKPKPSLKDKLVDEDWE